MTLLDGGMVDAIPLKKFQEMGYDRNIVILTQPRDYFKKKMKITWLIKLLCRKFPMVGKIMERRHLMYNEELEYIAQEEKKGNTLIIAPDCPLSIGRTELSEKKIRRVHQMGYEAGKKFLSTPHTRDFVELLKIEY
jgi:predicted patatin/cPLA2 family phospholipase